MKKIKYLLVFMLIVLCGCSNSDGKKETDAITPFEKDTCYKYHYQQLNNDQKKLYRELFNIFTNVEDEGKISDKNINDINIVHNALLNDHPELFYVENEIVYSDYRVEVKYTFTKNEIIEYQKQIEKIKKEILDGLPEGNLYEKMLYIYNYVVDNVHYNLDAQYNQTIISSMLNKDTVCTGYSKMIQYLFQEIGVNTAQITGTCVDKDDNVQRHAWNMIQYNGDYYYIDATWGDQEDLSITLYEYFLFSSNDMLKIYTPEDDYETTSNLDNTYFIKNNLYYTDYNKSLLVNAVNKEDQLFRARFSDEIYDYVKNKIANTNDIFDILKEAGVKESYIHYWYDDNFKVITVKW